MAYPFPFHRLVIGGTMYDDETWNTSLAIAAGIGPGAVDAGLLSTVAGIVSSWYTTVGGLQPYAPADLTYIKLNRIDTAGHYVDNPMTHEYPGPVGGIVQGTPLPQASIVASLRTPKSRGIASKGRMYLPPLSGMLTLEPDGRLSVGRAEGIALSVQTLINGINDAYDAWGGVSGGTMRVSVISKTGSGDWRYVNRVLVGRVVDTMRSRRSSIPEDWQDAGELIPLP